MNKRDRAANCFNIIIFLLTLFSTISMIIGFQFMGDIKVLSARNIAAFRYFTVDSNVLAGVVSLVYLIYMAGKKKDRKDQTQHTNSRTKGMPLWLTLLKLGATTGVSLTMMVTVFFLAPTSSRGFFALFMNSNFFFHFIIPVLCILSFVFFERPETKIKFKYSLTGIIPMVLYSIYYTTNILLHLENGKPTNRYDLYGFLGGKLSNAWFVIPAIYLMTWGFSILLWWGNKKANSKK